MFFFLFHAEVLQQIRLLTVPMFAEETSVSVGQHCVQISGLCETMLEKKVLISTLLAFLNRFQTYVGIHISYEGKAKMCRLT